MPNSISVIYGILYFELRHNPRGNILEEAFITASDFLKLQ